MPWTTAPPTYRSIPSLSLSASPSESALATSLRPPGSVLSSPARAGRNLSCEVVVERSLEAATGPGRCEESGRAPRPGIALAGGDPASQCLWSRLPACALLPGAASPEDPRGPRTLLQPAKSYSCQELPAGVGKLFPSPRADQTARLAFRAWDGAPRLGTPCSLRHARTVGDPHLVPLHGDSPPRARRAPERPFKACTPVLLGRPFFRTTPFPQGQKPLRSRGC